MTTHVFVVDSTTFKYHLEYLFAGTGAKKKDGANNEGYDIDFNNNTESSLHSSTENMLVDMIADINRVRKGDFIIFYLQQNSQEKIAEGKFYGIFKVKEDLSFLDNYDDSQYLNTELNKSLTFRTLIEPYKIYPKGVTEWEALDDIKNISSPCQMLWSLIYRKLKAKRGNTMITIYESERLRQLIRNKNNREEIDCSNKILSFDSLNQEIICLDEQIKEYEGEMEEINILERLIKKYNSRLQFESHLQAYITKNIGREINASLDELLIANNDIEWIGNEVSCGVGMQRIDIMISTKNNDQRILIPIELKAVEANIINTKQIQRYIDWIEQYYIPNMQGDIRPFLITKKINNKTTENYQKIIDTFNNFNSHNSSRCENLKYIEYYLENDNLIFEEINY